MMNVDGLEALPTLDFETKQTSANNILTLAKHRMQSYLSPKILNISERISNEK